MALSTKYINREISWLSFNDRVLQEAADPAVPLFERIRFIGIFSNNLDEFFRVRVATVRRMVEYGKDEETLLGNFTPQELHDEINNVVFLQQEKTQKVLHDILKEMESEGIFMVNEKQLTHSQGIFVRKYFHQKVLPNLVPIMLSKDRKFPYLRDRSAYLAVKLSKKQKPGKFSYALIRIPSRSVPRFLVLPEVGKKKYWMMLDDVIRYCLNDIFPIFNYDKFEAYTLKVTRDAELDIDDDISKSFIEKMEASLKQRKKGTPVRLIHDEEIPADLMEFIMKKMKIDDIEKTQPGGRYHNQKDFMDFPEIGKKRHYYQKLPPIPHKDLYSHESILKKMRKKDIMLHYPYQSFSHFIDLLREAAIDPKVVEIGITIYRVADSSKVMNALLNAIRNGKKVTVVVELQARFDEESNIYWSNKLQEEGALVINGIPGLKVHSKLLLIKREEKNGYRNYAYVGTGNFHEGTANVYADDGLLTGDPRIANEVALVFELFRQPFQGYPFDYLVVSPFHMRDFFCRMIDREIELAKEGKPAYMILKMNSIIDVGMMDKLYEASKAGVKIRLIIRGIYGLKTDDEELSKNIEAISIVDKYLEHSRILLFGNGGDERIFISSADWMPRNINRRIEVACPIFSNEIKEELRQMLKIQLKDNSKARILNNDLSNKYNRQEIEARFRAQEDYYNYIKQQHHITMKIYHNPRCAKSREGLKYLEERGYEIQVVNYMRDGISVDELRTIMKRTHLTVDELIRKQEQLYKEQYKNKELSDDEWLTVLSENPRLLQRPIVLNGNRGVLAQPPNEIDRIV
ncbi:MAG: polyphosphate kinase 1 [Bacteroidetes bacterium GWF2_42_66]|nr:MAG: polyphosphate kinase 1 [Bacteroidetes bacterium GWA2_42_15]OFX97866.1 MAG: polyphosphate kinase 1 [Bacteroidetes bacterium GWE2_42_39]OFY44157.1 MAG: polyphosphate kinase 1 [Bacteroidetes bacterium GWF2_42_66]HBL74595.1 polyphosphate kinase 1 [Prolixibacteraceae bacterium]HCU60897.1 polyphosphate kinase 1 [Prolixibacteraceae bacterium]